jgi:hypothetical protein
LKVVLVVTAIGVCVIVILGALLVSFVGLFIGLGAFAKGNIMIMLSFLMGAIVPLLLVGYAVYTMIRRPFEMRRLAIEGVETTGTVTRKLTFRGKGHGIRRYQIKYAYHDAFGREHSHASLVSQELYDSLEVGDPVKVVYLPSRPSVSGLLSDVELARRALERKA